ncbi:unnamed protein product [Sympodiomycopsis kandeliae]
MGDSTTTTTTTVGTTSRSRSRLDVLRAEIDDVRVLGALLRPIAFAAVANFSISDAGIQVTTEADRSVQAVAYISCSLFSQFAFDPSIGTEGVSSTHTSNLTSLDAELPSLDFDLNLHTLLECINIFGGAPPGNTLSGKGAFSSNKEARSNKPWSRSVDAADDRDDAAQPGRFTASRPGEESLRATSMRIRWRGIGYPIILLLEEADVTTRCELATFESKDTNNLSYYHQDTQSQCILSSDYLYDALQSIDQSSCSKITLLFSNSYLPDPTQPQQSLPSSSVGKPMFKLISDGDFGSCETEFFPDSNVLEKFTCSRLTVNSYKWSHFTRLTKAIQYSVRSSIRVANSGLLSLQLMMPKGTGGGGGGGKNDMDNAGRTTEQDHGFLEFLIVPLDEDGHASFEADEQRDKQVGGDDDDEDQDNDNQDSRSISRGTAKRQHSDDLSDDTDDEE